MTLRVNETAGKDDGERRALQRTAKPTMTLQIDGASYEAEDWSLSGCRICNYEGSLRAGHVAQAEIYLEAAEGSERLPASVTVVRFEPDNSGRLALTFKGLNLQAVIEYCEAISQDGME